MKEKWIKYQDVFYIVAMLLYPLTRINQGLSVIDTTYSLSNFTYFDTMQGTWMVATYLANVVGYLLLQLPFGNTMIGWNIYTSLLISGMAVGTYQVLKKVFPKWLVFLTQMIAIGLCWTPTTVLYHYLTYFFFQFAVLCLFQGITGNQKKRTGYFLAAGVLLGVNLAVRMPNVTHMLLIVAVWYGCYLYGERNFKVYLKHTGICVLGYAVGAILPLAGICIQYGISAYPDMVYTMFAMTEKATDYTPGSMLVGMFGEYGKAFAWLIPWLLVWFLGSRLSGVGRWQEKIFDKLIVKVLYILPFLVLFRFYWGKGIFDFRYYHYGAVYHLVVMFLFLSLLICCGMLLSRETNREWKVLALFTLLLIFVIPLGGNNALYPLMNDMFLILPVTMGMMYYVWRQGKETIYSFLPMALMCLLLLVQSIGFHFGFALQDGDFGDKRDTVITADSIPAAAGIYTTAENAVTLKELADFVKEQKLQGREAIFYGEVPGLGYLLQMPSALSTFWPDLDSYRQVEFDRDMDRMKKNVMSGEKDAPVIIVSARVAAFWDDDGEAMNAFQVPVEQYQNDKKMEAIASYMKDASYTQTFCNTAYAVYQAVAGE